MNHGIFAGGIGSIAGGVEELTQVHALSVLREFRNVRELIPEGDPEFPHMYLAELAPDGMYAWRKAGGPEQGPN